MAYPTVSGPYGFKPVNLIGGQVFAGSTRELPILYNYGTSIFFGDYVSLSRGFVQRASVTTTGGFTSLTTGQVGVVGIFLGCTYTSPVTKQKLFSQYWPASTLAGDALAYVADDPDLVLKAAVVTTQGGTTIGSLAPSMVGQNLTASDLAGNVNTGNSQNALFWTTGTTTNSFPLRLIGLAQDTAVPLGTATYSSISTSTITTAANIPFAVPVGAAVASIAPNGQLIDTGAYVTTAIAANSTTSVVLNAAPVATIAASATLVCTQYQEGLVKMNFGLHEYYSSQAV